MANGLTVRVSLARSKPEIAKQLLFQDVIQTLVTLFLEVDPSTYANSATKLVCLEMWCTLTDAFCHLVDGVQDGVSDASTFCTRLVRLGLLQ